jgi:bla regulator protein blaR1
MTALELLRHSLVAPLGWALVHFLWQGMGVAGLLAIVLTARSPRRASLLGTAEARYLAACLALGAMVACPVITMSVSLSGPGISSPQVSPFTSPWLRLRPAVTRELLPTSAAPDVAGQAAMTTTDLLLPAIVAAWLLGVVALSARLLGGWIAVQRLRRRGTRRLHGETSERFGELARRMGVDRPVVLLESPAVSVPAVIGWLRAAVLVPTSALSGLPPDHLEAVLAHELAHIRRNDYLVNLLQSVVEIVLFYHPAVWWIHPARAGELLRRHGRFRSGRTADLCSRADRPGGTAAGAAHTCPGCQQRGPVDAGPPHSRAAARALRSPGDRSRRNDDDHADRCCCRPAGR